MIWESRYWKEPLVEAATRLATGKRSTELAEDELAQIERDIFIGFYSVRKLLEAPTKLTDRTRSTTLRLEVHPNRKPVTWRNSGNIDQLYDLSTARGEDRGVLFVCGRIIHSFVFAPCVSEIGGLEGIFFSSDRDKDTKLYFLCVDQIIKLFVRVGEDNPSNVHWSRNPHDGKETLIVK